MGTYTINSIVTGIFLKMDTLYYILIGYVMRHPASKKNRQYDFSC